MESNRHRVGCWTFYSTVTPDLSCARYFGGQVERNVVTPRWIPMPHGGVAGSNWGRREPPEREDVARQEGQPDDRVYAEVTNANSRCVTVIVGVL